MSTRARLSIQIDRRNETGRRIVRRVARVEDLVVAVAAFEAASRRWPAQTITLRHGGSIIENSRTE
jgi:hypothetical protein